MTEETTVVANPMEMQVTTNSAPVEQQSTPMITTEPQTHDEPEPEVTEAPIEASEPDEKANAAARRAIEAEIRAENAERQLKDSQEPKKELGARPKIEDFDTLENFEKALVDYAKSEARGEVTQEQSAAKQRAEAEKLKLDVQVKARESRTKHADFDQVVAPLARVMDSIPILSDFIARNPLGTEIAYELGKQPALLEQLRGADHWTAGEMLLNMAARLKKPAAVSVSNAPEPIKTVGNRETVKPKLTELATKDINSYIAKRNKQELDKRRAH